MKIYDVRTNSIIEADKIEKPDEYWKQMLTEQQYLITTKKGTEVPGTCLFDEFHEDGLFRCIRCSTDLFLSSTKFNSGTGWPSYYEPVSPMNIKEKTDTSHGMRRTEVLCARCGSHLGHVFNDGPLPTRKRYCMNGLALKFVLKTDI